MKLKPSLTATVDYCRMGAHGRGEPCACAGSGRVWRRPNGDAAAPALDTDDIGRTIEATGPELWARVPRKRVAA